MSVLARGAPIQRVTLCLALILLQPAPSLAAGESSPASPLASGVVSISSEIPVRREQGRDGEGTGSLPMGISLVVVLLGVWAYFAILRRRRGHRDLPLSGRDGDANLAGGRLGWLQRFKSTSRPALEVLSSTHLAQGHSVHVLRWQGQEYLIGCAGHTIEVLASSPIAKPIGEPEASSQ